MTFPGLEKKMEFHDFFRSSMTEYTLKVTVFILIYTDYNFFLFFKILMNRTENDKLIGLFISQHESQEICMMQVSLPI